MNKKLSLIPILLLLTLPCLSLLISASNAQSVALSADQVIVINQGIQSVQNKLSKPPKGGVINYELFIEIDYMKGHEPTDTVLMYIHDYYYARGISVTFYINDIVVDPTPDTKVTGDDFANIEANFNDHDFGYYSKWKWVLFGLLLKAKST
ncbi:MAG: hypothetical protein H3Z54_12550 [archaeon]|nr:hypothetical protein [archaeon]